MTVRLAAASLLCLAQLAQVEALPGGSAPDEGVPAPRFADRIAVERVLLDLRIVDGHGRPIEGLAPADLRVTVDGRPAPVESLSWVSGTTPHAEGLSPEAAASAGVASAPPGRLIVLFFQKDLASARVLGLMRMKSHAVKLLDGLEPGDRVAVVSFDTQLRLWTDFSDDRLLLRRVVERSVLMERPPSEVRAGSPSLLPAFDHTAARRAASAEAALAVVGNALKPLPGIKSLAFFGWGLGRLSGGQVAMLPEYDEARRALARARAVVFSLDVTDADYHSLEVGLEQLAEDTGGFYAKTHLFPASAMMRLESALLGYYSLSFERPPLPRGRHQVEVRLVARKGEVLTRGSYVD
jgi:VWFA-related protein